MVICKILQVSAWQRLRLRLSSVIDVTMFGVLGIKTKYQKHVLSVEVLTGILRERDQMSKNLILALIATATIINLFLILF